MKIHCPHCGVKGSADDSYSGRKVKCPKCTGIFEVEPDMVLDLQEDPTPVSGMALETDSPGLQEESLDWADIASEIDLDLTEEEAGEENEENLEGAPTDLNALFKDNENSAEEIDQVEAESIDVVDKIEQEPYGIDAEQCWQCGKKDSVGGPFTAKDGRLYCTDCIPVEEPDETWKTGSYQDANDTFRPQGLSTDDAGFTDGAEGASSVPFSIKEVIREAWAKTKGAKGTIWAGSAITYLVILIVVAGGAFLLPSSSTDLPGITGMVGTAIFQAITNAVSVLFTAGLLFMGIRKVAGRPISWKMTFNGFPCAGKIIIATILQSIFIIIGFLLLILPGIYLAVGYSMTLPLIVDKNLSPWQAMETSRKAIHKMWWKVAGLFVVMGLIFLVSLVPLGIGLIWTWPMFIILAGVLYRYLYGDEEKTA